MGRSMKLSGNVLWLLCVLVMAMVVGDSVCCGQQTPAIDPKVRDALRSKLSKRLKEVFDKANFPGGSVALILPDGNEMTLVVGKASKEDDVAMDPSNRLMSGSIGKTYFAAMAVDLIQQKKLSLADPVSKYLGTEDWFAKIPNGKSITIAHLMRHQSGLPRYIQSRQLWQQMMDDPDMVWKPGKQLSYIYDAKPLHAAGESWAYSDTNYILLGLVLEKLSARKVYDYVDEKFLKPNELNNTVPNNRREIAGLIQGYTQIFQALGIPEKVLSEGKFVFNPAMEWCGGGYASTPLDLACWGRILYSGALLDDGYIEMFTQGAVKAPMLGKDTHYGLGGMIRKTKIGTMWGHDGTFPGYTSTMGHFPKHGVTAAFMFNSDGGQALAGPPHEVIVDLVEIVVQELGAEE